MRKIRLLLFATLALGVLIFGGAPTNATSPGATERVSVDSAGNQGNDESFFPGPTITPDGRYVAFESQASNLVADDTIGSDVFVHDRQTAITTRVSVDSAGNQANHGSYAPTISAEGRYVAFESYASNLVLGDTNDEKDIFVHDRQTGITTLVSVDSAGGQGNNFSESPAISGDGRYVAFESSASDLVPGDTNGNMDVFLHDRQTGTTTRISVDSSGTQGNSISQDPSISGDGRYVAFNSWSRNLVPGDTNSTEDIFVYDRDFATTERVSVDSAGYEGNGYNRYPAISADGRYVAFSSWSNNLVGNDTNGTFDIFVHDRETGITERVSVDSSGGQANRWSLYPAISTDGRYVAFESYASNLVLGDTNTCSVYTNPGECPDIFVHDRQMGITERVSVNNVGQEGNDMSCGVSDRCVDVNANGRYVAFCSHADNLVVGDTNGYNDVFVRDRCPDGSCGGGGLSITKLGPASVPTTVGASVGYTVTVANTGALATGLFLTDILPQPLRLTSATWSKTSPAGSGTCAFDGTNVSCAIGDLAPGATATVSLATTLRYVPTNSALSNMACWTATDPSPTGGNCAMAVTGVGQPVSGADLAVSLTGPSSVPKVPGTLLTYEAVITNIGPGPADNVAGLLQLPVLGVTYDSAEAINNSTGQQYLCLEVARLQYGCGVGSLPQGGTATVTLKAAVTESFQPSVRIWAQALPPDANPTNSKATWETTLTGSAGSHSKVVFVQGINSDSWFVGGGPDFSFKQRVQWIVDYLTSNQWLKAQGISLTPWTGDLSPGDFRFFSYSGTYSGEVPLYGTTDTCSGVSEAASKLGGRLTALVDADPTASIVIVTHSMGGLVVGKWLHDNPASPAARRLRGVVTFDSPLRGIDQRRALLLGDFNWAAELGDACGPLSTSVRDLTVEPSESEVVRQVKELSPVARFYTIDATRNELVRLMEAVPGNSTFISTQKGPTLSVDRRHSNVWDWGDEEMGDRLRASSCVARAVAGKDGCSRLSEAVHLNQSDVRRVDMLVSPEDALLSADAIWEQGTISAALVTPEGVVLGPDSTDPPVRHTAGTGYETYEVDQPQPGVWQIEVTAVAVDADGEDVSIHGDGLAAPPLDADDDGAPDGDDNCELTANASQSDADLDGLGDACDPDIDNDGVANDSDNCPDVANVDQVDLDGDGRGEPCDGDNDDDGMSDAQEAVHPCLSTSIDDSAGDSDIDGLVNLEEVWLEIDPCDADADDDAFNDGIETHVLTDPLDACPDVLGTPGLCPGPSCDGDYAWPPDLDIDAFVSIADVLKFKGRLGKNQGDPGYVIQLDLNADGSVMISDVLRYRGILGQRCTNP